MASSCQVVFARIKLARSLRELATRAAVGMVVEDQPGSHKLPEKGTKRRCDCGEPLGGAPGGPLPGGALERPRRCSALEPERPGLAISALDGRAACQDEGMRCRNQNHLFFRAILQA